MVYNSYGKAVDTLKGRGSRKIGNNTYLKVRDKSTITILYHSTDVVTYHTDGSTVLDSGGWKTVTTKERINWGLPDGWSLWQERGIWTLHTRLVNPPAEYTFADGMSIEGDDTTVKGEGADPKATQKLRKRVQKYSKDYIDAMLAGEVPAPSAGDCFYCAMREANPGKVSGIESGNGRTLGECFKDQDHILSHLEESYFVPSLLPCAFETFGASLAMKCAISEIWQGKQGHWSSMGFLWTQARKMLSRYMLRQLGEVA